MPHTSRTKINAARRAVFVALVAGVTAGCAGAPGITAGPGIPCATDESCRAAYASNNWACDPIARTCYELVPSDDADVEPIPDFEPADPEGDEDPDIERFLCDDDLDCPAGTVCNTAAGECRNPAGDNDDVPQVVDNVTIFLPDQVGFGAVLLGQERCEDLLVRNGGVTPLTIFAIEYDNVGQTAEFRLEGLPQFPLTLEADTRLNPPPRVCYRPVDPGADSAFVQIISNATNVRGAAKVRVFSEEKGRSRLCVRMEPGTPDVRFDVDADALTRVQYAARMQFPNVGVGQPGVTATLKLENCGDLDGNRILRVTEILFERTSPHFTLSAPAASPQRPLLIAPGEEAAVDVLITFNPVEPTFTDRPPRQHVQWLTITSESDYSEQRAFTVDLTGQSRSGLLEMRPSPAEFGATVYGNMRTLRVNLLNPNAAGQPIEIRRLDIVTQVNPRFDTLASDFPVFADDCTTPLAEVNPPVVLNPAVGVMPLCIGYRPREKRDANNNLVRKEDFAYLRVQTNQPGSLEFALFPLLGKGKPPNVPPEARISLQRFGPQVTRPIQIRAPQSICFFSVSIDPDADDLLPAKYNWVWRSDTAPPERITQTAIEPLNQFRSLEDSDAVCVEFTRQGTYYLQLTVTDIEGAVSTNTDNWVRIDPTAEQAIAITMLFYGAQGAADVNLEWSNARGGRCSQDTMTSTNSCNMGTAGAAQVTQYTVEARRGTTEEIVHNNPIDGTYFIRARLFKSCDRFEFSLFNIPICLSRARPRVEIRLWDPTIFPIEYFQTLEGRLNSEGDELCWAIERQRGVWGTATPCP